MMLILTTLGMLGTALAQEAVVPKPMAPQPAFVIQIHDARRSEIIDMWSPDAVKLMKFKTKMEQLPGAPIPKAWKVLSLKKVMEGVVAKFQPEENATVDLLVFESGSGKKSLIPRWFLTRYDLFLAETPEGLKLIPPTRSFPKSLTEHLPLISYVLEDVKSLQLTSYELFYQPYILKKKTDPAAVRGEKFFLQSCLACYSDPKKMVDAIRAATAEAKPEDVGLPPKLDEKDWRALKTYVKGLGV